MRARDCARCDVTVRYSLGAGYDRIGLDVAHTGAVLPRTGSQKTDSKEHLPLPLPLLAGLPVCVSDRVIGLPDTVRTAAYNDIDAWVETISAIFADAPSHETLIASAAPYRIEDVRKRWKHIYESF